MIALQSATDAKGFANMSAAASAASRTFRDAAASTGMFEVQQLRLNSATDDYVKKLKAQKLSLREIAKSRKIAAAAYKEQLAMENMTVRQGVGSNRHNKGVYDVIIPKEVSAELDTAGKRLAFMNAELKSGAHQMVNWGKNTQWAGRQLMVGFTMPIAAFGAAAGVMAYQVDKELTRIQKVYDTVAQDSIGVEKELAQVRLDSLNTAAEAARQYGQSATDTLNVQAELAATGKQGVELQKSTLEVMRIARLGEVEHQTAIDATIALQSIWRMSNDELTESFDYMNSIENATSLSTADFAEAIPVAASAVKAFGGDVKELGILLTAMKENGIGASEGANALKATMQRLGRPSKQIREEWTQLTGTDITKLVDDSDGLVEVFTKINKATAGIDEDSRRKAFAGLFGSYQVSKMMALTKGMGELEQGIGQVSTAYEVSNQTAEQWANTAEKEVERYQKSISGMWDTAFNTMKIELAEVGEPFVELATYVVTGIGKILKAFNDMPDFAKKFIAGGIALTALAGGVLMLAGLFGNLAGNLLKGVASLVNFATKIDLIDKESKAAKLATDASTSAYLEQANAVSMLTMQIDKLTAAQIESNQVMLQTSPAFAGMPPGLSAQQMLDRQRKQQELEREMEAFRKEGWTQQGSYFVAPMGSNYTDKNGNRRTRISAQEAEAEAQERINQRNLKAQQEANRVTAEGNDLARQRTEEEARKNKHIAAGTAFMAVEGAAMATMLFTSNETAHQVAQIAMAAGLVAPALALVKPVATVVIKKLALVKAAMVAGASSATLFAGGLRGAGVALMTMMGPVGWIATGLTALAGIVWTVHKREKEQLEARIRDQKTLNDLAKSYSEHAGAAYEEYRKLHNLQLGLQSEEEATQFDKDLEYYKNDKEGKKATSAFKDLGNEEQAAKALDMFVDLQVRAGLSATQAAGAVKALYIAAEQGGEEANDTAQELLTNLGKIQRGDFASILRDKGANFTSTIFNPDSFETGGEMETYINSEAEKIAGLFSDAMSRANAAGDKDAAKAAMAEFETAAMSGWEKVWTENVKTSNLAMEAVKTRGITNAKELSEWYAQATAQERALFEQETMFDGLGMGSEALNNLRKAQQIESELVNSYAKDFGNLDADMTQFSELMKDVTLQAASFTMKEADEEVKRIGLRMPEISNETATAQVNAFNLAHGFLQGRDYAQAVYFFTNRIKAEALGAASGANALAGGLRNAKGAAAGLRAMLAGMDAAAVAAAGKEAIQGMQNELADGWRDDLADQQQAEADRQADYWDNEKERQSDRFDAQSDALSDRHEAEQRAFDASWDAKQKGLENYWDARIKGVEKAIEAEEKAEEKRQKMFDAEIARINRLADIMNTGIDFNVALNEGNLDEAAKIANTAQAKDQEFIFNRERERGADKSAARVDRLGDKQEGLENQKDAAMEAFDKRREAASAHFQKMQEMEQESLEKRQDMAREDLEKRAEMDKKALDAQHERQKENLDRMLKTFLASTPTTKKALQKQVEELGAALDKFGIDTLDPMSKKWGNWFKNRMRDGLTNSALEAASSAAWEKMGKDTKDKMLAAWGFKSEQEFMDFINGKLMVDGGGSVGDATPRGFGSTKTGPQTAKKRVPDETQHTGGVVGSGNDNRYGVAKNYKGQHPSEILVNAQKGEYIVNKDAAKKFGPELDRINAGRGVGGGRGSKVAAVGVGAITKGLWEAGKRNLKALKQAKAAQAAAAAAMMGGGSGSFSAAGYTPGVGGWQRPSVPGLGWSNTHDYRAPTGTPVYAPSDGVVVSSRAITSGGSPGNGGLTPSGVPYRSYGEHIAMRMADGNIMNFGHLSARYVGAGQTVKGGALMGRTGNTGNSSGPHLHMDVGGNYNASGYLASRGIALRKGTEYVRFDNTAANLHRGESVLTKNLTSKMHEGVDKFAQGPTSQYNVTVNIDGYNGDKKALAREVINEIKREAARAPQSRSVGGKP